MELLAVTSCLLLAAALLGCTTTQDTAKRVRVRSARLLAERKPIQLRRVDHDVKVVRTWLIRGEGGTAISVLLRNTGDRTLNDLPLAVGVRGAGGQATYLNRRRGVPYFQSHAPALAPGQEATWVYTSKAKVPAGSAFARVGVPESPPTVAGDLPEVKVSEDVEPPRGNGRVARVEVSNDSDVTQYDLGVYAAAEKHGRVAAAGQASVEKLDPGDSTTVRLKLIGNPRGALVRAYTAPTIFE